MGLAGASRMKHEPNTDRRIVANPREGALDRRAFLKRSLALSGAVAGSAGAVAGAAAALADLASPDAAPAARRRRRQGGAGASSARPNVLVVLVDQMRTPTWSGELGLAESGLANVARIRRGGVSFGRHYTASNDCTPARAALVTGLYTHQTGCMITGGSTLDPAFPTWGRMLRDQGYDTRWYGKWHLTHHDNHWNMATGPGELGRYGFAGGTFPSPDGGPGQGWRVDPQIAAQFRDWFHNEQGTQPWCVTTSFVNPHDIAWWYRWSERFPAEARAPRVATALPPNFETPEELVARGKPALQRSLQDTAAASFGAVPFHGADGVRAWLGFMDLYVKLQREVDRQIGVVLDALASRPEVAANTVIVFSSDHGEYAASHGLRGKGASAYEEGIRVPLIVNDPRQKLTAHPSTVRSQLTSSVDVAPLLLTIATGSNAWRSDPRYAHLADRADLAAILADPTAAGRPYIVHATDEIETEFADEPYAAGAPLHVTAIRTPAAKLATYTNWAPGRMSPMSTGEQSELYDYRTRHGRLELENLAGRSPLEESLRQLLDRAVHDELQAPLPTHLAGARLAGLGDYQGTATRAAIAATRYRALIRSGLLAAP